jgi:hypothetical protein
MPAKRAMNATINLQQPGNASNPPTNNPFSSPKPLFRHRQHFFQALLPRMFRDHPASPGVDHGIELGGRRQNPVQGVKHLPGVSKRDALPARLEKISAVNAAAEKVQ